MSKKILQTGLYTTEGDEVEALVGRVSKFNLNNLGNPVQLDVIPYEEGDEFVPAPHYKLRFLFPSRDAMRSFWTA